MKAAIYARVSTSDQHVENQLAELRSYVDRRAWTLVEYVDAGVSGARDSRPALDELLRDARRCRLDVLVVWRLDRLGRNLRHLLTVLEELQALGISFVSLGEGIDLGTPAGRLQLHILAALSEFERARIQERIRAGITRAKAQGVRFGRPEKDVPAAILAPVRGLSVRQPPNGLVFRLRQPTAGCLEKPRRFPRRKPTNHAQNGVLEMGTPCFTIQVLGETRSD